MSSVEISYLQVEKAELVQNQGLAVNFLIKLSEVNVIDLLLRNVDQMLLHFLFRPLSLTFRNLKHSSMDLVYQIERITICLPLVNLDIGNKLVRFTIKEFLDHFEECT